MYYLPKLTINRVIWFNFKFVLFTASLLAFGCVRADWQNFSFDSDAALQSKTGDVSADEEGLSFTGGGMALLKTEPALENFEIEANISVNLYPRSQEETALFRMRLPRPITTDKIRITSNEEYIRVVDVGIFEAGMPDYPSPLAEEPEGLSVPNYAKGAEVSASSFFGGFTPEKAVDGKIGYTDRWVSGSRPPHYLIIDMGQQRNVGFIQMLTGHPSGGQWSHIAREFSFYYWQDGAWHELTGVRQQDEPGAMGLIIGYDDQGYYKALHRNEEQNWAIEHHRNDGTSRQLAAAKISADIVENSRPAIKAIVIGSQISLFLNNQLVIKASADSPIRGNVGIWSGSEGNRFRVNSVRTRQIDPQEYCYAGNMRIMIDSEPVYFRFVPDKKIHEVQLPSTQSRRVALAVEQGAQGQQINIDGRNISRHIINIRERAVRQVPVEISSADGTKKHTYIINILPIPPAADHKLVFADDFTGDEIDTDIWYYRIGRRWNSVQSPDNVRLKDGKLDILLTHDEQTSTHIAGGIISKELFGYGYYETSAKLWHRKGWHSAFWQMGYNPPGGHPEGYTGPENNQINEIDGFESVDKDWFSTNLQYYSPRMLFGARPHRANVADDFNVYGWEWTPEYVRFFFNGELVREEKYLPPHGLQNVWLSCVTHDDAELEDLPGVIHFDYFRYYRRDYGLTAACEDSIIYTNTCENYFETGQWEAGKYALSHKFNRQTRKSDAPGSTAGWNISPQSSGEFEIFVFNSYIFADEGVTEAVYSVQTANLSKTASINPIEGGQSWVSLGKYELAENQPLTVSLEVNNQGTNRIDSVMIKPVIKD